MPASLALNPQQIGGLDPVTLIHIEVEIDESKYFHRKCQRGQYRKGHWVFGGVERGSRKCFLHCRNIDSFNRKQHITRYVHLQ